MINDNSYDVAIVGGGLAGLACASQLSRKGYKVILFEKEAYPFHKVCGEYISLESREFLKSLGLPLDDWKLPLVNTLSLSSPDGTLLTQKLPLGGIGVSRYLIDNALAEIARSAGVSVSDGTRVIDVNFHDEGHTIFSDKGEFHAHACCGAFGKRSNLDIKWKRNFTQQKHNALNNYIAVKYHALLDHPRNNIALHNFRAGYCGIAPVEEDKTCICYLTTAQKLRTNDNSIEQMEQNVLYSNPYLKKAFCEARMIYEKPIAISQISFDKKEQVLGHMLMLGDAGGLITPLCGNGMSMALHGSTLAATLIDRFLCKRINRETMEYQYIKQWQDCFGRRLRAGRIIQAMFGKEWLTNTMVSVLRHFPAIVTRIIRQTHGNSL